MKPPLKHFRKYIAVLFLLLALPLATAFFSSPHKDNPVYIAKAASLYGARGQTKARNPIEKQEPQAQIKIELEYGKKRFTYVDKKITPTNHIVAEEIFARMINCSFHEKRAVMNKCIHQGSSYKNAVLYTMPLFENIANNAIKVINTKPANSKIEFDPNDKPMFTITREIHGLRVNEEMLYADIYSALMAGPNAKIIVKPEKIKPEITAEDNVKLTKLRTRYATNYAYSNPNRKDNIKLALKKINGAVLPSNAEFSFNKTVGKRSAACGFKEAKIIVGGKYENGIGGGVCQASTTVYNAALLAGLEITSAKNHSLECKYELPSFDAMVSSGQDLRFKNTGETPVFIRAFGTDSQAVVEIYGSELPFIIKRKSEIVSRKPAPESDKIVDYEYKYHEQGAEEGSEKTVSLPHGELKSMGYLLYYDSNGFLLKREKIRSDTYHASRGLIAIAPPNALAPKKELNNLPINN